LKKIGSPPLELNRAGRFALNAIAVGRWQAFVGPRGRNNPLVFICKHRDDEPAADDGASERNRLYKGVCKQSFVAKSDEVFNLINPDSKASARDLHRKTKLPHELDLVSWGLNGR
jgi:hypothetical protein